MSQLREALQKRLIDSYHAYFDIEPVDDGTALKAICAYHNRDSQYVLVKQAELWAAENHEYLYLFSLPRLDPQGVEALMARVLEDGMPRIRPHSQHMYTYLTALILCDGLTAEGAAVLKKAKKRREFKLSLHGWMEFRIAAVDLSTGEISTNRSARDLQKGLRPFVDTVIKSI